MNRIKIIESPFRFTSAYFRIWLIQNTQTTKIDTELKLSFLSNNDGCTEWNVNSCSVDKSILVEISRTHYYRYYIRKKERITDFLLLKEPVHPTWSYDCLLTKQCDTYLFWLKKVPKTIHFLKIRLNCKFSRRSKLSLFAQNGPFSRSCLMKQDTFVL